MTILTTIDETLAHLSKETEIHDFAESLGLGTETPTIRLLSAAIRLAGYEVRYKSHYDSKTTRTTSKRLVIPKN